MQAGRLTEGLHADADKGYDSNAILDQAKALGMGLVILPKKNRRVHRPYDEDLYKARYLIENIFLHLKHGAASATRYAQNTASFLTTVHIRCIALGANIS